jgi:hypothetical protein
MGGVDRFNQNLACSMIQHRTKKLYWPVFRFCVDLAVQNAFELYQLQKKIPGIPEYDLLSFRREIVQLYMKTLSPYDGMAAFPPSRLSIECRVLPEVRTDATQRRCVAPGCKGTSVFSCEKCNVGLHPSCFKAFRYS